ncbi:hypothetical protein PQQ81_26930 [Paraburkholderia strydomiana]|uniref:hypothetical protein n=1 Tax=Paraburkholderia strydomiana TaxID=1245417 RepID=UPI0038B7E38D
MSAHDDPNDGQFEMFENPAGAAIWPNPGTNARALLDRLMSGERITQPDFKQSWRLAAYAGDLRELGWPVQSEPVSYPHANRPIARYFLSAKAIAAARSGQGGAA